MSQYQNIQQNCVEKTCGKSFVITSGEQEFFAMKGFTLPKRCQDCRAKKKAERANAQ